MPKKYAITTQATPPRLYPVGRYATVEFREDCAGSCRECVKKKCVYNIFADNYMHMSQMDEPEYLYTCNSCFRCVQECTKGIFSRVINPEYRTLGDDYWTPAIINRTWYQAHTGSIPVSGAGYRGPFVGEGFESMWTDMSEIVRPTRDGIHGREYINTMIELTRRPQGLRFNTDGSLKTEVPKIKEVPYPMVYQLHDEYGIDDECVRLSMAKAARETGQVFIIAPELITGELKNMMDCLAPKITVDTVDRHKDLIAACPMVEISYGAGLGDAATAIRAINKDIVICVKAPLSANAASIAVEMADMNLVDVIHYAASHQGKEVDVDEPRYLRDAIRDVHLALVDHGARLKVNLLFSGGIAMAEHVIKAIICGADGVVVDASLLLALECRLCGRCMDGLSCNGKLEEVDPEFGKTRIMNLMAAWRNQLLEMLGAMGLREVRRLRGEVGRSMWFENLEKESFAPIFGERKVP
jgi:ferredoxin